MSNQHRLVLIHDTFSSVGFWKYDTENDMMIKQKSVQNGGVKMKGLV